MDESPQASQVARTWINYVLAFSRVPISQVCLLLQLLAEPTLGDIFTQELLENNWLSAHNLAFLLDFCFKNCTFTGFNVLFMSHVHGKNFALLFLDQILNRNQTWGY